MIVLETDKIWTNAKVYISIIVLEKNTDKNIFSFM